MTHRLFAAHTTDRRIIMLSIISITNAGLWFAELDNCLASTECNTLISWSISLTPHHTGFHIYGKAKRFSWLGHDSVMTSWHCPLTQSEPWSLVHKECWVYATIARRGRKQRCVLTGCNCVLNMLIQGDISALLLNYTLMCSVSLNTNNECWYSCVLFNDSFPFDICGFLILSTHW
jgi:hypothetical protein